MEKTFLQDRLNQVERQMEQTIATYNMMLGGKQELLLLIREFDRLEAEAEANAKAEAEANANCNVCDEPVAHTPDCEPACTDEHQHECLSVVNS